VIVVSKSSLERAPACPRALAWMFHKGYRRPDSSEYLEVGRAFHAGLARWYTGASEEEAVEEIRKQTLRPEEPERLFRWYIQNADDSGWKPVAVEIPFGIQAGSGAVVGILDLIIEADSGLWVVDHKTARSVSANYFSGIERDPQVLLYEWAAVQCGFQVSGFIMNVLQKTKTPELFRYSVPFDARRIEWVGQRLATYLDELAKLPSEDAEIIRLPGNPLACRTCPFAEVCELDDRPEEALATLELLVNSGEIERRDYDRFAVVERRNHEAAEE
jgi:CRISPR/Cas system-associated exonuclease Cas4 (RecB family)